MLLSATSRLRPTLIGAALLLVLFDLPIGGRLFPGSSLRSAIAQEALFWLYTALILAYVVFVERRPLTSIGLSRPTWKSALFGLAGAVVMTAALVLIYTVLYPLMGIRADVGAGSAIAALPKWFLFAVVVRAAIFEEIFYRGFAIERLTEITGKRSIAALLSLIAFTFAHLPGWGWAHLIVAGTGGTILTALYLWRRDLSTNMIAHFFTDAIGFLLT